MTKNEKIFYSDHIKNIETKIATVESSVKGNGKGLEERMADIERKKQGKATCELIQKGICQHIESVEKTNRIIVWLIVTGGFGFATLLTAILIMLVRIARGMP